MEGFRLSEDDERKIKALSRDPEIAKRVPPTLQNPINVVDRRLHCSEYLRPRRHQNSGSVVPLWRCP